MQSQRKPIESGLSIASDSKSSSIGKKCLENLDLFGLNFNFQADGQQSFRTRCGAVLTIIYICITFGLFMGFGMDLYNRKHPKVSNNSKLVQYEKTDIDNKNFTFAFRVEDRSGKEVINSSIVNLELTYFNYIINSKGQWEAIFSDFHPFVRCADLKDIKQKEQSFNVSLLSWYCIDFEDLKMGGNWDGNFVYGLLINTKQCSEDKQKGKANDINNSNNNSDKNNLKKCLSEPDMKANFQSDLTGANYFYSFMYIETLPEMDDYEQPIKTHLVNKYEQLSLKASKRSVQTYKKVMIENDGGWLFRNVQNYQFFSSDSILTDFSFKEEFSQDIVYTHLIYFGNKVEFYNRSYMKIQEVIANIGGFSKIFYTFISYFYMFIGKYLKNRYLISRVEFAVRDNVFPNINENENEMDPRSSSSNILITKGLKLKELNRKNLSKNFLNIPKIKNGNFKYMYY